MFRFLLRGLLPILLANLVACVSIPSGIAPSTSDAIVSAQKLNWQIETIPKYGSNGFKLFSARKTINAVQLEKSDTKSDANPATSPETLIIYIEGDGHVWDRAYPSLDPTPLNPIGFRLALKDDRPAVAYLARPCQYIGVVDSGCIPKIWTDQRFNRESLEAMQFGVDYLKQVSGAKRIVLVGYSGGGALALLIAAHRADVIEIVTVAGNLDVQAWLKFHHLPPMKDSLNPVDFVVKTKGLPQIHYVGAQDQIVPPIISHNYNKNLPAGSRSDIVEIPEFSHTCCWVENWQQLLLLVNKP